MYSTYDYPADRQKYILDDLKFFFYCLVLKHDICDRRNIDDDKLRYSLSECHLLLAYTVFPIMYDYYFM